MAADPQGGSSQTSGGAKRYQRTKLVLFGADLAVTAVYLLALQFTDLDRPITYFSAGVEWLPAAYAAYLALFFLPYYAVTLPFRMVSGYFLERSYGLVTQSFGKWALDEAKRFALAFLLFLVTGGFFFWATFSLGKLWWVATAVAWFVFSALLTRVFPAWIIPLFYPMKPLEPGPLRDRLLALCVRCGVPVPELYEIKLSAKTVKANAAVVGIGKGRRVILGDTLLTNFPPDEIEMVMAHELGHHVMRHVTIGLVVQAAAAAAGFGLLQLLSGPLAAALRAQGLYDPSMFPFISFLAAIAGAAAMPAENAFSRALEYAADAYALKIIPSKETFRALMTRLGEKNLADLDPHPVVEFVFYSHPSIRHRIERAERIL